MMFPVLLDVSRFGPFCSVFPVLLDITSFARGEQNQEPTFVFMNSLNLFFLERILETVMHTVNI